MNGSVEFMMNKKMLAVITAAILVIGLSTIGYAKTSSTTQKAGFGRGINNTTYNNMIDLMKKNGFGDMAKAMQNRDWSAMSTFMNNLTDDQYNQMIDIMNKNGYGYMGKMMGSISRQDMLNLHNSMMGR